MVKRLNMLCRVLFFSALIISCNNVEKKDVVEKEFSDSSSELVLQSYNYAGFKPFLEKEDDKVHIINFWATWCKPCVEELPYFEMINTQYSQDNVKVTLVSLDMPSMVDNHVIPFLKKNNIYSEVILLDDPDADYWIRDINEDWSGAIPATIIYKNGERKFYEKSFTFNELQNELKTFL